MKTLLMGILPFLLAFIFHLTWWRFCIPPNPKFFLLKLFLIVFVLKILITFILPLGTYIEFLHSALLYWSVSLSYTAYYQGLVTNSPTLVMVMKTHDAGNQGLDEKQLYDEIYDDVLIKPRLEFLVETRLGYMDNNKYFLTY